MKYLEKLQSKWRYVRYIIRVLSPTCNQSFLIAPSPRLFSQGLSITPVVSHLCFRLAQVSLQRVTCLPLLRLSCQPKGTKQTKFPSIISGSCTVFFPALLPKHRHCQGLALGQLFFFLPSLPPQQAHRLWFNSHFYVDDPKCLSLSQTPYWHSPAIACLTNPSIRDADISKISLPPPSSQLLAPYFSSF